VFLGLAYEVLVVYLNAKPIEEPILIHEAIPKIKKVPTTDAQDLDNRRALTIRMASVALKCALRTVLHIISEVNARHACDMVAADIIIIFRTSTRLSGSLYISVVAKVFARTYLTQTCKDVHDRACGMMMDARRHAPLPKFTERHRSNNNWFCHQCGTT
jgi:hypothetical protein